MLRDGQPALRSRRGRRLEGGLLSMRFFYISTGNDLMLRSATWRVSKHGPWVEINETWYKYYKLRFPPCRVRGHGKSRRRTVTDRLRDRTIRAQRVSLRLTPLNAD